MYPQSSSVKTLSERGKEKSFHNSCWKHTTESKRDHETCCSTKNEAAQLSVVFHDWEHVQSVTVAYFDVGVVRSGLLALSFSSPLPPTHGCVSLFKFLIIFCELD